MNETKEPTISKTNMNPKEEEPIEYERRQETIYYDFGCEAQG